MTRCAAQIPFKERNIPVLTRNGIIPMTSTEYEQYTNHMGHLPVMPKAYIFGNTIPMPKTDKNGRVRVAPNS
jgi:hypothetical protein